MELLSGLKQLEGQISVMGDRITMTKGKLEDLLFRAQRISAAAKNNMPSTDSMFGYDLQAFRRGLRTLAADIAALPPLFGSMERQATYDDKALKFGQSVLRMAARLASNLKALHDTALLAHQHIRAADHKMEAWYIAQEIEEMAQKGAGLPTTANKIVIGLSTPTGGTPGGTPPAAPPAA